MRWFQAPRRSARVITDARFEDLTRPDGCGRILERVPEQPVRTGEEGGAPQARAFGRSQAPHRHADEVRLHLDKRVARRHSTANDDLGDGGARNFFVCLGA